MPERWGVGRGVSSFGCSPAPTGQGLPFITSLHLFVPFWIHWKVFSAYCVCATRHTRGSEDTVNKTDTPLLPWRWESGRNRGKQWWSGEHRSPCPRVWGLGHPALGVTSGGEEGLRKGEECSRQWREHRAPDASGMLFKDTEESQRSRNREGGRDSRGEVWRPFLGRTVGAVSAVLGSPVLSHQSKCSGLSLTGFSPHPSDTNKEG